VSNTNNPKFSTEIVKYSTKFLEKERKRALALILFFKSQIVSAAQFMEKDMFQSNSVEV
jgi:hypothetical protein